MKKVTIMYMKGLDFKHLLISIDGKKFNEDKTDFISSEPIPDWFSPSDDDSFEWTGLIDEIERYTNTSITDIQFEFKGSRDDEEIFWEELNKHGIKRQTEEKQEMKDVGAEENNEIRWQKDLDQAYIDLKDEKYISAFRGFKKISEKLPEAKFKMGEMYLFGKGTEESHVQAFNLFQECEQETGGFPELNSRLAQCYYCGFGIEKNEKQAYEYASRGYDAQKPYGYLAHYIAGSCLLSGNEVNKNLNEAINNLQICADAKYAGFTELGEAFEEKEDYTSAFLIYKSYAEYDADCYYYLAKCYEEGKGVDQDPYEAFENMKKVPETNLLGMLTLAQYYLMGFGTEQNLEKSFNICQSLLDEYPEQPELLDITASVYICQGEYEQAMKLLKRAIELGSDDGKKDLGYCYIQLGNYKNAESVLESALINNPEDGEIYNYLGECYFNENSPLKNNSKAIPYLEKAALLGNADAASSLFEYYVDIGDEEKGMKYHELAIKNGDFTAKILEGIIEFQKKNIEKAIELLSEGAQAGDTDAQYYLGHCYINTNYAQRDVNQGIYWLTCAADGGNGDACFDLSCLYEKEETRDEEKSYEFELKGAELGDDDCKYWLARRYLYNEKYKNEKEAIKLLRELSKKGIARAKLSLAEYYYEKYGMITRKIGLLDDEEESTAEFVAKIIPYVNLVSTPVIMKRKKNKQKSRRQELNKEDIACIKEMVNLYKQLNDNPKDLTKDQIKIVKSRLRSIDDDYRR